MTEEQQRNKTVGSLLSFLLQHMKCMESRIEFTKALTNKQEKYVLTTALNRINSGFNAIFSLIPDSTVAEIKQKLERPDLVYMMVIMEEMMQIPVGDIEEVVELINDFIQKKYGQEEEPMSGNQ